MMKQNKYTTAIIIVIMLVLNGFLILQNITKTRDLEILNDRIQVSEYSAGYTIMDQYKKIPFVKTIDSDVWMSVFISDKGCKSCIKNYISNINALYKKYSHYIVVYYLGLDKKYLKELGAKFEYVHLPEANLYGVLKTNQPISVLSDKSKNVLLSNISLLSDHSHSDSYFKIADRLFAVMIRSR